MLPPSPRAWFFACWLGLVPTVLSLVLMTVAVHEVGATPTAIMGALEPLTAVAIGVMVFGESLTFRLAAGIVLILSAVLLIVLNKNFPSAHHKSCYNLNYQKNMAVEIITGIRICFSLVKNSVTTQHLILLLRCSCGFAIRTHRI